MASQAEEMVYTISSNIDKAQIERKKSVDSTRDVDNADFETAISATKFGKFNILLFLLAIPAGWTSMLETTTMSYVFPAAHCDLNLSLNDRGALNAITFFGMVSSGFLWGFLCDTLGRKKLLVAGYLLDAMFVIMSAFSQDYTLLLIFKFLGGFIINGPFAALTAYLSEFHCSKYRSKVQLLRGMIVSCGTLTLPLLAWGILPQQININLLENTVVLHSWNIFLLVSSIPALIGGISFIFMPESPKFLMTVGRNEEALEIFQKVFVLNTGKIKAEFPIKSLIKETEKNKDLKHGGHITAKRTKTEALREGFQQIKPMFFPPHLKNVILVCLLQSLLMLTVNTLRLWFPQIFQAISDYQYYNNGTTDSLCKMLEVLKPSEDLHSECHVNFTPSVYLNTMTIAAVTIVGYLVAGSLINRIGKKILLGTLTIISGVCAMSIYFSQSSPVILIISSLIISMGSIGGNVIMTVVIDLFPTSLRAITISLVMMLGRSFSMVGNLVFPLLLSLGCAPPFFSVGCFMIACSVLTILLPKTDLVALQ